MKRKLQIGLILAGSLLTSYSFAQEAVMASANTTTEPAAVAEEDKKEADEATFTLSGSIDVYGRTSLGTTNDFGAYGPSTAFGDLKGFGLGMANLIASYGGEKTGFTADLVFGPRGQAAVFGSASGQAVINQMYAYLKLGKVATFNLGQFNTFLGYEVISPAVNFHYSTSYLFSWGPFSHTGARLDLGFENGLVAKVALMNPTDIVEFNPVNTYTFGAQIGYANEKGGIWVNALLGDQDGRINDNNSSPGAASAGVLSQIDVTTGWNFGEKFYLGLNTSVQSVAAGQSVDVVSGEIQDVDADATSFFGFAVYPKFTFSESFALGARAEMFSLSKGHLSDSSGPMLFARDAEGNGSVTEITLTANYKVGGLTIIPEVRIDSTSEDSFTTIDGKASKSMTSALVAFVYKF